MDRESRHAALSKALPDAVAHPGCEGGNIRAKLERDIFLLCDTSVLYTPPPMPGYFSGGGDPGLVKLRNRALAPRNRSAAEHQSFAWLRGRLPEYNKT